ncbi:Histone deacetylase [Hondaea fermentalgiana]|uniref:histone deacetylase n=1 Tax=Hondaea fermentalgiana TaxID=2315210 RepID=A0A2R5GRG8_9STRA|nr:Histone deacetylase [Hondaea fermentalgiana]|eukprot:GBG33440.1 Histone deacetylase [Hondaea fermentalgiana]
MDPPKPEDARVTLVTSRNLVRASDAVPAHHRIADVRHGRGLTALPEDVWGGSDEDESADEDSADKSPERVRARKRRRRRCDAGRNEIVQALITASGLLNRVKVVEPQPASLEAARALHEDAYLQVLGAFEEASREELMAYNLVDDAAPFPHVLQHALWIAGASLCAAAELAAGSADIAVNLCGGRHHAGSSRASGFCFVNDIVLAAQELQRRFGRVMIVDIDVHHGDGTERAFLHSNKVLTISFHQREPGFFPGTGDSSCRGKGKGEGYNVNVPFTHESDRAAFLFAFEKVFRDSFAFFSPGAVVFVCGVDALKADPRGGLSLEAEDIVACTRIIRELCVDGPTRVPLLVTGAGGYDFAAAAKTWTRVVAELANAQSSLPEDVPEHEFFEMYGPSWRLR